jgi:hypothetical protein
MKYISNRSGSICYTYDEELLEWLQANYPYSQYQIVEAEDEVVS